VRELRVHGASQDLTVQRLELIQPVRELAQLRGTHKREVQGIEHQDDVLADQVGKTDTGESVANDGDGLEVWRGASHDRHFSCEAKKKCKYQGLARKSFSHGR
jgi:hypothetical protein